MEVKPGYKMTAVGVIPEDWEVRPFLSLVKVASGQVDPKIEPYCSMFLVAPDHIESCTGRLLKKETAEEQRAISGKYIFSEDDIVYSKIRPNLRKAILANFSGLCSADMYPLKPNSDISAGFIFATILGEHFSKYAESVSIRSGMPKINRKELADYTVAVPPTKAEQEAITSALSDVDAFIESLEQLIAKKRNIKQGAMQELLTGKRRLPGFQVGIGYKQTELGLTPVDWDVKSLRSLCAMKSGISITGNDIDQVSSYPCYGGNGLRGYTSRYTHNGNYALVGRQGALCGNVTEVNGAFFASEHAVVVTAMSDTSVSWLAFVLRAMNLNYLSESSAQPGLSVSKLLKLKIVAPQSKAEQESIAETIASFEYEIVTLESKLSKARHLKQAMMQELLTGRIRLV